VVAEKEAFITELKALIETLEDQVQDYRHTKLGPKSENLDPAQLELALEDLETAIAEAQAQIAAVEDRIAASATDPEKVTRRAPRKAHALPEGLPRVEQVIDPTASSALADAAPWSGSVRWRKIRKRSGEPFPRRQTERLDYIPARYQGIVTVRPRYACPKGRAGVVQVEPWFATGSRTMARGARASVGGKLAD
jgi:transposase